MVLYPRSRGGLSERLAAVKIARHSPCEICECSGLHPATDVLVVLDDEQSIDNDNSAYLSLCACRHGVAEHGANSSQLGRVEFDRRSRAAFRLDEILHDLGKLLDFAYTDDDIASLRRQMKLPVSVSRVPPSVHSPGTNSERIDPPSLFIQDEHLLPLPLCSATFRLQIKEDVYLSPHLVVPTTTTRKRSLSLLEWLTSLVQVIGVQRKVP